MQRITKLDNDLTCKGMLMKLWNKTLLASALCLTLFGCDDASKVDNKLDKAKDNAEQMKDAAADKAQAIKAVRSGWFSGVAAMVYIKKLLF